MNVRVLTALTLALAVALAGCGDTTVLDGADGDDTPTGSPAGDGDGSPGTTDEVSIEALAFAEQEITVALGPSTSLYARVVTRRASREPLARSGTGRAHRRHANHQTPS